MGLYIGLLRRPNIHHVINSTSSFSLLPLIPPTPGEGLRLARIVHKHLGKVKRTTATPSVPWRERLRRSVVIVAQDTRSYRIVVHSRDQGNAGLMMLQAFPQEARQRITFIVSKRDHLGKRIVQK